MSAPSRISGGKTSSGIFHAPRARRPHILEITVTAEMQSQLTLLAGEIALRTCAQIEERRLPAIEAVIDRVDVLREQALQPRSRQFRQSRQPIFRVGDVAPDVRAEAIDLHKREQRTCR